MILIGSTRAQLEITQLWDLQESFQSRRCHEVCAHQDKVVSGYGHGTAQVECYVPRHKIRYLAFRC